MSKFMYEAGRFIGQTKRFVLKSPFRFTLSVLFAVLYFLLCWAFLYQAYDYAVTTPTIDIPFLGRVAGWDQDQSIMGLLLMTVIWIGAIKIDAADMKKPEAVGFLPRDPQLPLYFKSSEAAFEMACKYLDCTIVKNTLLPAIVLDAKEHFSMPVAVKKNADGNQVVVVKVASDQGGFIVPASTLYPNGPDLEPGNLVYWMAGQFNSDIGCWNGFIVAKLKPQIVDGKWTIEREFTSSAVKQKNDTPQAKVKKNNKREDASYFHCSQCNATNVTSDTTCYKCGASFGD